MILKIFRPQYLTFSIQNFDVTGAALNTKVCWERNVAWCNKGFGSSSPKSVRSYRHGIVKIVLWFNPLFISNRRFFRNIIASRFCRVIKDEYTGDTPNVKNKPSSFLRWKFLMYEDENFQPSLIQIPTSI